MQSKKRGSELIIKMRIFCIFEVGWKLCVRDRGLTAKMLSYLESRDDFKKIKQGRKIIN